jgi:hypothetical protein
MEVEMPLWQILLAVILIGSVILFFVIAWKYPRHMEQSTANDQWLDDTPEEDSYRPSLKPTYQASLDADTVSDSLESDADQANAEEALPRDEDEELEDVSVNDNADNARERREARQTSRAGNVSWSTWRKVLLVFMAVWALSVFAAKVAGSEVQYNHKWPPWAPSAEAPVKPKKPKSKQQMSGREQRLYKRQLRRYERKLRRYERATKRYNEDVQKLEHHRVGVWILIALFPLALVLIFVLGWAGDRRLKAQDEARALLRA